MCQGLKYLYLHNKILKPKISTLPYFILWLCSAVTMKSLSFNITCWSSATKGNNRELFQMELPGDNNNRLFSDRGIIFWCDLSTKILNLVLVNKVLGSLFSNTKYFYNCKVKCNLADLVKASSCSSNIVVIC